MKGMKEATLAEEQAANGESAASGSGNSGSRRSNQAYRPSTRQQVKAARGGSSGGTFAPATPPPVKSGPTQKANLATGVKPKKGKGEESEDAKRLRQRRIEDYMEVEESGCNDPETSKYLRMAAIAVLGLFTLIVLFNFFSSGKDE